MPPSFQSSTKVAWSKSASPRVTGCARDARSAARSRWSSPSLNVVPLKSTGDPGLRVLRYACSSSGSRWARHTSWPGSRTPVHGARGSSAARRPHTCHATAASCDASASVSTTPSSSGSVHSQPSVPSPRGTSARVAVGPTFSPSASYTRCDRATASGSVSSLRRSAIPRWRTILAASDVGSPSRSRSVRTGCMGPVATATSSERGPTSPVRPANRAMTDGSSVSSRPALPSAPGPSSSRKRGSPGPLPASRSVRPVSAVSSFSSFTASAWGELPAGWTPSSPGRTARHT